MNGNGSPTWKWLAGVLLIGAMALFSARIASDEERIVTLEEKHQATEVRWATVVEELRHISADLAELKALVRANTPTVYSTTPPNLRRYNR